METQKEGYDDDIVNTDTDQETNNEESKEIYRIEDSQENDLESDESETDERDHRKHPDLHKIIDSQKIGHDDYSVATDIYLESNVTKNIDLSTSNQEVRQLTEYEDDIVAAKEEISFDDLTITGDYSD